MIRKLRARWQVWRNLGKYLGRRVDVENRLINAAHGKRPLPDADECMELAQKLGIPD